MNFKKYAVLSMLVFGAATQVNAQQKSYLQTLAEPNAWVDSVLNKMSKRDKVAQMFFIRALTNADKKYEDSVGKVIRRARIGGLVFFQGGPGRQANLTST